MKKNLHLLAFLAVVCSARPASASIISVGDLKDNTLYQDVDGSLSDGAGQHFFAGVTAGGSIRRGLIAFDIASAVPAGATINSVSLKLNMSRCGPTCGTPVSMELHRVLMDWGEAASNPGGQEGGGGSAAFADATWLNTFYPDNTWTNAGGDFAPTVSAATTVGTLGSYVWTSAQMKSDVQSWLNAGSNYGWLLMGGESSTVTAKRFDTKENITASFRPVLTINYTPLPEPSTIFFVGGGMIAILRLRRR